MATNAPVLPATIIQPPSDACRSRGAQVAIAFSGAIRQVATPSPINARATSNPPSLSAKAKTSAPLAEIISSAGSTRRGP